LKNRNRKIVVENQVFIWNYTDKYERTNDVFISRLFFSPKDRKNIIVESFFKTNPHIIGCHFNFGFLAIKDGVEHEINFNHPGFISEFIKFILDNKVDFAKQERYSFDNAADFLQEMGYHSFKASFEFFPAE